MADVVILIPTLGRPQHIKPLLESIYSTTDRARPLFIVNRSDEYVIDAIKQHGEDMIFIRTRPAIRGD